MREKEGRVEEQKKRNKKKRKERRRMEQKPKRVKTEEGRGRRVKIEEVGDIVGNIRSPTQHDSLPHVLRKKKGGEVGGDHSEKMEKIVGVGFLALGVKRGIFVDPQKHCFYLFIILLFLLFFYLKLSKTLKK